MNHSRFLFALSILALGMALASCDIRPVDSLPSSSDAVASSSSEASNASPLLSSSAETESYSSSEVSDVSSSSSSNEASYDPKTLYGGYYANLVSWTDGADLIEKLRNIISTGTYNPISYNNPNWSTNQKADLDLFDRERLDVVYSGNAVDPAQTNYAWQREHAFPASLMTGKLTSEAVKTLGRATDFHNLLAAEASGNSSRGNKNYGVANPSSSSYKSVNFESGGYRYDEKNFEPADIDKGRLSRALFYMATMYSVDDIDEHGAVRYPALFIREDYVNYSASSYDAYAIGNLSTLLNWSQNAVDYLEYQHNQSVYQDIPSGQDHAQGNRNPYVDFPALVDYAFGAKKNQSGTLEGLMSSYESLHIDHPADDFYTIQSAKREYEVGSSFSKDDLRVGRYGANLSIETVHDWTLSGIRDGEILDTVTEKTIQVNVGGKSLSYTIAINASDPFAYSEYSYTLIGKKSGGDLTNVTGKPATDNVVSLGGVNWILRYESGDIGSTSGTYGVQFGTGTKPVGTLTLESQSSFSFNGKSSVKSIHLKGAPASGTSYPVSFYLGDTLLKKVSLAYTNGQTCTLSSEVNPTASGKVRIVISSITKAVYVHSLAVDLE